MANIDVRDVCVSFPIYEISTRSFRKSFLRMATGGHVIEDVKNRIVVNALKNITLTLKEGDRVGLIGHNGAGKSTLLRLLAQIYEPNSGKIHIDGNITPILNITQGIESEFTGYENIFIRGTVLGLSKQQIQDNIDHITSFSGLGDYLAMPIRTYSSGMMVRLAFAISTCMKPDILLLDEVFGAGDANFMEKAREKMISLLKQSSIVLIASHSNSLIKEFCNKALLLEKGEMKYFGDVDTALELYSKVN